MFSKEQTKSNDKARSKQRSLRPDTENLDIIAQQQTHPATIIQRVRIDSGALTPRNLLQLQRTIGNQAVVRRINDTTHRHPVQKHNHASMTPLKESDPSDPHMVQRYFEWQGTDQGWVENGKEPTGKYFFNNHFLDNQPSNEKVMAFEAEMAQRTHYFTLQPTLIPFKDCSFRVQNPKDTSRGGDPKNSSKSKVSETEWNATESSVDATIQDFSNIHGKNEKLWLQGLMGLVYVGINPGFPVQMTSQIGLCDPDSIVTIILPSAFSGGALQQVRPSLEMHNKAQLMLSLVGLNGRLNPEGRLWVKYSIFELEAMRKGQLKFIGLDGQLYAIDFTKL